MYVQHLQQACTAQCNKHFQLMHQIVQLSANNVDESFPFWANQETYMRKSGQALPIPDKSLTSVKYAGAYMQSFAAVGAWGVTTPGCAV